MKRLLCLWFFVSALSACATPAPPLEEPTFRFVILPDTQIYSLEYPEIFDAQTRWIAEQHEALNIRFVLHEGDITDRNTPDEWARARAAMARLDGVVDYALVPGNHDYGTGGSADRRETPLADYFPLSEWQARPSFGGSYEADRVDSTYHVFDTPEGPWLILALEFGTRPEVLAWADGIAAAHDMPTVVLTHAYLYSDGTRYDHTSRSDQLWSPYSYGMASEGAGVSDAEETYAALVVRHPRIALVLSGHVLNEGVARQTSVRPDGSRVHEVLANFQHRNRGGDGFLRIVEVFPDRFQVRTYSPYLDEERHDDAHEFTLAR